MVLRPWVRRARLLAGSPAARPTLAPRGDSPLPLVPLFVPEVVLTGLDSVGALGRVAGPMPGAS